MPFQCAVLRFGLYSLSGQYLLRHFIRIKFLGLLVLFNFFTSAEFGGRLARLAFISVAIFAVIPSMGSELPKGRLVLPELLVLLEILNLSVCLLQSYLGRDRDYSASPWHWESDPWYLVIVAEHLLTILITFGMYIVFKCHWEPQYKTLPPGTQPSQQHRQFFLRASSKQRVLAWNNPDCRQYFSSLRPPPVATYKKFAHSQEPIPSRKIKPTLAPIIPRP